MFRGCLKFSNSFDARERGVTSILWNQKLNEIKWFVAASWNISHLVWHSFGTTARWATQISRPFHLQVSVLQKTKTNRKISYNFEPFFFSRQNKYRKQEAWSTRSTLCKIWETGFQFFRKFVLIFEVLLLQRAQWVQKISKLPYRECK